MITVFIVLIFALIGLSTIVWFARRNTIVVVLLMITLGVSCFFTGLKCEYSNFERMVNFLSSPDDIDVPLASTPLSEDQTVYLLTVQHKYPGNHRLSIAIPSYATPDDDAEKTVLDMRCKIFDDVNPACREIHLQGSPVWGSDRIYAFSYWDYKVPQDLPRSVPLHIEVSLIGDVAQFLLKHNGAELLIQKSSDE